MTTEFSDEDMATLGRSLMDAIDAHVPGGWSPAESPSEIVGDLVGELDELRATIERQAAQIEMLREFIARAPVSSGVCCCGEAIDGHSDPMSCGHTPVDLWDHSVGQILSTTPDQALEQFAARVRGQCAKGIQSCGLCGRDFANEIRAIKELPK